MDYCKVNQVAKFDTCPMPQVEKMFESMRTASVISTLNLSKGYRGYRVGLADLVVARPYPALA